MDGEGEMRDGVNETDGELEGFEVEESCVVGYGVWSVGRSGKSQLLVALQRLVSRPLSACCSY